MPDGGISLGFRQEADVTSAQDILSQQFTEFVWKTDMTDRARPQLRGQLLPAALQKIRQNTMDQMQLSLGRRVNELGVAEAVVQQEGIDRVSVDLPGIQDATQAKNIIGKTANLEFHLVDTKNDAADAAASGVAPAGDELYTYNNSPVLLFNRVVLSGDSITSASASFDQSGRPSVNIRLGGGGETLFSHVTGENIGQPMSVVYLETKPNVIQLPGGQTKVEYKQEKHVINVATIQSTLGMNFEITGLTNPQEARNLGILLRAGTLPASLAIIQERTVGPSMGRENIHLGMMSLLVGMFIIVIFMMVYYEAFGVVANLGLLVNLIFLLAILSALGAVLTFPGIAGVVLTIGMAIDYNVLIFERIREELRQGTSPQAAIHTGYDRAFITIIDANLVSLIVALILFALGSGAVKGFAIIMTIGLFTSIISSVTYTRAMVNWIYGGRRITRLWIGMKVRHATTPTSPAVKEG
jgi:preprotein translocase subunit SecD